MQLWRQRKLVLSDAKGWLVADGRLQLIVIAHDDRVLDWQRDEVRVLDFVASTFLLLLSLVATSICLAIVFFITDWSLVRCDDLPHVSRVEDWDPIASSLDVQSLEGKIAKAVFAGLSSLNHF